MQAYLDNAATTMIAEEVLEEINLVLRSLNANPSSMHRPGQEAARKLEESRLTVAKTLGVRPEEVIFTASGTESDNMAIRGIVKASGKKHIVTSQIEHSAILNTCKDLERDGIRVTYLGVDNTGRIDPTDVEKALAPDTALVSIMHANNEIGTVQDISMIGQVCRKHHVYFHTDAVQSFGKIQLDLKHVDLASISAHKVHGPKGVAALYLKRGVKIRPIVTGGGHELGMRAGTENVAYIAGFARACELISHKFIDRKKLVQDILRIKGSKLNGSLDHSLPTIINISFKGKASESLLYKLDDLGISCSAGSACTSRSVEPSHVLQAIGQKDGGIRFSLSRYTTQVEADYLIKCLEKITA